MRHVLKGDCEEALGVDRGGLALDRPGPGIDPGHGAAPVDEHGDDATLEIASNDVDIGGGTAAASDSTGGIGSSAASSNTDGINAGAGVEHGLGISVDGGGLGVSLGR